MKRLLIALVFLFAATVQLGHADRKHEIVFEATVLRIDYWGWVKYSCGVAINYRLAEYKVDRVERGSFSPGDLVVVRHLACNWNELDDLKVGDKVVVTVVRLKHPEKTSWQTKLDSQNAIPAPESEKDAEVNLPIASEPVSVQFDAKSVARVVYPSRSK